MKVLVFGGGGQVGRAMSRAAPLSSLEQVLVDRRACDITKAATVSAVIAGQKPDLVINLAAYTAVDQAESDVETAWEVNCTGAANIAAVCSERATPLVQLSTDYVFDGLKPGPYHEEDEVNPLGVYGRSKEAGERAVRAASPHHIILRTAWVYGAHGANFVKTILRLAQQRPVLRVVADQYGCPTAAADIAAALVAIGQRICQGGANWGTFHFTGADSTSWHGFAETIIEVADGLGAWPAGSRPRVEPITSDEYPTAARRPMNSVLDCRKIEDFGISPPPWRPSLAAVVSELLGKGLR
jgi:dTDP-4-dehydrorhamnose reductase